MTREAPIVILHVIEGLGTGGSEQQLVAFLVRSDRTRFRHEVCTLGTLGRFTETLTRSGIPVHTLRVADGTGLTRCALRLWRLVRAINPDVVHATLYRPAIASRLVGWAIRRPVVTTLVNTTYEPEWYLDNPRLNPRKVWLAKTLDTITARRWGTRFVAVTGAVKASAIRQLGIPEERIKVIRRGLVLNGGSPESSEDPGVLRATMGWVEAYPLVLSVGRLVPQKGQQYAIRAMRGVIEQFSRAHLLIAGDGPLRRELEALVRTEGLEAHVSLLGERRDVDRLLRCADVFVLPSLFEGAANALLEAMAAATPCVVSRIPSLCEISDNGKLALLADLRSPEALAAQVLRLAEDRDLAARLGRAAQGRVLADYDIEQSVRALEHLYRHLVGPGQAPGLVQPGGNRARS